MNFDKLDLDKLYSATCFPFNLGWCCWCFMCCFRFCRPRQTINVAKKYVATNPPGLIVIDEDTVMEYTPNDYELEAYRKITQYMKKI